MVALGSDLYVLGGLKGGDGSASVEVFNTATETWNTAPDMLFPRFCFGAVELGGLIYVMGGTHTTTTLYDQIEALDPGLGLWQPRLQMPAPGWCLAGETDGTLIYAIGIFQIAPSTRAYEVNIYDPGTDTWSNGPPMPVEGVPASDIVGTEIFVVLTESRDMGRTLLSFDTVSGTWTTRSPRSVNTAHPGVAASGGLLYVFGGRGAQ